VSERTIDEVLLLTADPMVVRGITRAALDAGLAVRTATTRPAFGGPGPDPAVIVVDLEQPGAIDEVAALRARLPDALLVGHVGAPNPERWLAAERAGCDVVANRGAVGRRLGARLRERGPRRRRFPLLDAADVAGRLGLVARVAETPLGPVAVYQLDGRLLAVEDRCPHAGATLSEGAVEGGVVTCPGHGSQFEVATGERVRGPADLGVRTFDVVVDGGRVHLVWA
jgi:nitrite reductase/ring-hydroxylating ferredoxin subunit